ncbi:hypothetical protein [Clostridium phage phi CD119]|uniref:Uncharacterized protein n=7 Tax=root TaxID=1 RepID=Q24LC2_BPPCD|nr:hypothetical protein CDBPCV119_gp76 [Clostridium phage phi CD119]AAZ32290.1 hypothetical protein [Clostridium phage phi CD119]
MTILIDGLFLYNKLKENEIMEIKKNTQDVVSERKNSLDSEFKIPASGVCYMAEFIKESREIIKELDKHFESCLDVLSKARL